MRERATLSMATATGLALILLIGSCHTETVPNESTRKFIGHWTNEDPKAENTAKAEIRVDEDSIKVNLWRYFETRARYIHLGEERTTISDADDGVLSITWKPGFCIMTQKLTVTTEEKLRIQTHTHYTDDSGRLDRDSTKFFVRSQS